MQNTLTARLAPSLRRRLRARLLALTALCAAWPLGAAEPALDRLVPADAALVVALNDLPALRRDWPESSVGRALADPQIARFFAPFTEHADVKKILAGVKQETGYGWDELLALASGDVLLTVPTAGITMSGPTPKAEGLLAIEVGENEAKLRDLLAAAQAREREAGVEHASEDYNGVTLHAEASSAGAEPEVFWALHEGRWFIGTDRATVTAALDALAAGGLATGLASSPDYQKVIERSGGSADALFYLNWKAVYPALIAAIEAARDPAAQPNMLGIEPVNVMKALGLDAIEGLAFTAVTRDDTDRVDGALTFSESRGLVALMAYRDGPVARPDWVPAAWFNVSSQNLSLADAYAELERILDLVSPMVAGMAQGQLKTFERQLGIELKRDIIGSLGTSFVSGYAVPAGADTDLPPPYDELDQLVAISLADAAAFERAVETIKGQFLPPGDASPLKKRDYLGRTLHTFENPADGRGITYAISDGWLLVGTGSPAAVEAVVQLMHAPKPEVSFWQRADVRAALADVPARAFSLQHSELAPLFASLAASVVKFQASQPEEKGRFVDPEAVPSRELLSRYFKHSVSHGERAADGLYFHAEGPAR